MSPAVIVHRVRGPCCCLSLCFLCGLCIAFLPRLFSFGSCGGCGVCPSPLSGLGRGPSPPCLCFSLACWFCPSRPLFFPFVPIVRASLALPAPFRSSLWGCFCFAPSSLVLLPCGPSVLRPLGTAPRCLLRFSLRALLLEPFCSPPTWGLLPRLPLGPSACFLALAACSALLKGRGYPSPCSPVLLSPYLRLFLVPPFVPRVGCALSRPPRLMRRPRTVSLGPGCAVVCFFVSRLAFVLFLRPPSPRPVPVALPCFPRARCTPVVPSLLSYGSPGPSADCFVACPYSAVSRGSLSVFPLPSPTALCPLRRGALSIVLRLRLRSLASVPARSSV